MTQTQYSLLDLVNEERTDLEDEAPSLFTHSPYYDNESLSDMLIAKSESFKVMSLNVQSLNAKFNELQIYIQGCCKSSFNAICLQETWLSDQSELSMLQLDGYTLISKGKSASNHGGVAMYLKDTFSYKTLPIASQSNIWDGLFIEVHINDSPYSTKSLIIGNIYRPPRDNLENYGIFMNEMEQILHNFQRNNKEVIITGDFNIDLLKIREKNVFNEYFEVLITNGFIPKITLPSRITTSSSTLIDNILMKLSRNFSETTSGILLYNISDHFPCFISLDFLKKNKCTPKYVKTRPRSEQAYDNFKHEISFKCSQQRFITYSNADPNTNYDILNIIITESYNKHLPAKLVRFNKHKHKQNNWVTAGILLSIRFRDKLYKKVLNSRNNPTLHETLKSNLTTYNRILKQMIKEAKKAYYGSCFTKYKNDVKKTWDTIKTILNNTSKTKDFPSYFLVNGTCVTNPKEIADKFNQFYVNVGSTLSEAIVQPENKSFKDYLLTPVEHTFHFHMVTDATVSKIIADLKPKSSSGVDSVSNKLLKLIKDSVLPVFTLIINQSLESGIFPDKLKIAKVVPIYKKSNEHLLENYRPISVLPSMSKVLERVMHNQLSHYLTSNNLLYDNQYGFRKSHSTEMAALELINRIISAMDKNELPLNIFLDLSKAFDTIDHKILIYKLKYYGLREKSLNLFENYLKNRKQLVSFQNVDSSFRTITTGVPQGSILGPLLFIIYINDFHFSSSVFHPVVYADDTCLSATLRAFDCSGWDRDTIINEQLLNISQWLKLNKLSLNSTKTKAMLFYNPNTHVTFPNILIDETVVEFVESFDYLGIVLDKNLSWKKHISKISVKLSKVLGIMNRLKHVLSSEILFTLYKSMFLPNLNYGLLCWKPKLNQVIKLQKKAIRIVTGMKYNAHTDPLFKIMKTLKISDICILQEYKFCYKLEHNMLPVYFQNDIFIRNLNIHYHNTRIANAYHLPRIKHEFAKSSIQYLIPVAYNSCPMSIQQKIFTHSLQGFAQYIKAYLISNYSETCTIATCYVCSTS